MIHRLIILIAVLTAVSRTQAAITHGPLMFEDDFSAGTGKWVMFEDDFSAGTGKWVDGDKGSVRDGWYHLRGESEKLFRVYTADSADWTDYIVEFDVKVVNAIASWMVRCDLGAGAGYYLFCFNGRELERNVRMESNYSAGRTKVKTPARLNEAHHMTIVVSGSVIRHYLDGQLIDTFTDDLVKRGGFGFREMNAEAGAFANVRIFAMPPADESAAAGPRPYRTSVPFTRQMPTLDGKIDDAVWAGAARFTGFSDLGGKLARQQTAVWALWDDANLYLAFESKKRYEHQLKASPRDTVIFHHDTIEVNVQPGAAVWHKLAFDPAGSKWDNRFEGTQQKPGEWNPDWTVANHFISDAFYVLDTWQAEIAIPFASLGVKAPVAGDVWPLQICRDFDDMETLAYPISERWTSWSSAVEGGFNQPSTFGEFRFVRDEPVFRFEEYHDIENGRGGMRGSVVDEAPGESNLSLRAWYPDAPRTPLLIRDANAGADGSVEVGGTLSVSEISDVVVNWEVRRGGSGEPMARGRTIAEVVPSFALTYAPLFTRDELAVEGDLARMQGLPDEADIAIRLLDAGGNQRAEAVHRIWTADKFLRRLSLAGVAPGTYTVVVSMLDGETVLASSKRQLMIPAKPDWQGTNVGALTTPPAPWTPVEVEKTGGMTINTWGKSYRFTDSPLPTQIAIHGESRLAAPVTLVVVTDQGPQAFSFAAPQVSEQSELGVTMAWSGTSADLKVSSRTRVEFDGLIWNDMAISPQRDGVTVQQAYIEIPMRRKALRYMRGEESMDFMKGKGYVSMIAEGKLDRSYPKPDENKNFSVDGWQWPDQFINFYWLGGVDFGLFAVLPSKRNLHVQDRYNELIESDDAARFRIYLIDKPLALNAPIDYRYGLIGTPTRPMRNRSEMNRTGYYAVTSLDWSYFVDEIAGHWDGAVIDKFPMGPKTKFEKGVIYGKSFHVGDLSMLGNPKPDADQLKGIKTAVNLSESLGSHPIMWIDLTYTPISLAHERDYAFEWEQFPRQRHVYGGENCTLVCPKMQSWGDYFMYYADKLMKEENVKGFYLDMTGPGSCSNEFHGCGYEADGKRHGEIAFLELRELFLRLYNVVHSNDPDGIIFMHSNSWNPTVLYCDLDTKGEGWSQAEDYRKFSLPYYQAGYMFQHQYNVAHNFFSTHLYCPYRGKPERTASLGECVGLSLLHDTLPCVNTSLETAGLLTVANALDDFGAYDAVSKWVPYWESGIGDWQDGPAVSYYQRNDQVLMVIFNHGFDDARSLQLDLKAWGVTEAYDVMTDKTRKAESIALDLAPRELALLWLR